MKSIILAAGEGTRLRPYTNNIPKCMVEVNGISLIDRQLEVLRFEGVHDITVIGGYHADKLTNSNITLRYNPKYNSTNMLWTLFCANDQLNSDDDIIISYGDIVYSHKILNKLISSNADISISVDLNWESYWRSRFPDPLNDAETLRFDENNFLTEIGQKPKVINEIQGQYMGLMKFSKNGQRQLRSVFQKGIDNGDIRGKIPEKAYMTDLIQMMIDEGISIKTLGIQDYWVEVDTVEDLLSEETRNRLDHIANECSVDKDKINNFD